MRKLDREAIIVLALYSTLAITGVILFLTGSFKKNETKPEERQPGVEEASFMLECVYEFSLEPEQCRAILDGGDPPKSPWKDGC